jgi:ubiquinone/menaquinone biosynthesis C-methylase UbiE
MSTVNARAFSAAQDFLLGAKKFWTTQMYPLLREQDRAHVAHAATPVDARMQDNDLYPFYTWMERHLQRMKYAGRYGLAPWHETQRPALEAALAKQNVPTVAGFQVPAYYPSFDVHQHPGGLMGDSLAGFVYERGARSTTPLDKHFDLHHRFTRQVGALTKPQRILDVGCGFGKSTRPFALQFAQAHVTATDLSMPCLKLAQHLDAQENIAHVRYLQADACATGLADAGYDLVTSTMLLHELPTTHLAELFVQAHRLLEPGGWTVHLDFLPQVQPGADEFTHFMHAGHSVRNNEPFMQSLAAFDLLGHLQSLGFTDISITPFAENDQALAPAYPYWRFPWTVVQARKAL